MSYKGRNSKSVNYYSGNCAGCGLSIVAKRLEENSTPDRWVKCGGEAGCGTVTRLVHENSVAPHEEMTNEAWARVFNDE